MDNNTESKYTLASAARALENIRIDLLFGDAADTIEEDSLASHHFLIGLSQIEQAAQYLKLARDLSKKD